ncbi:MAG: phosphoribosylaminoimidazolesuccinocarboxamide synthase [Thermoanaerobaculales bacterium]|nr:phosphoribosylaminoimidazolesuccinocarboxamide synthase [Thermoanaerobaculales bacterium]
MAEALLTTRIPDGELLSHGKVRDIYTAAPNALVLVATDRVSAFDHVLEPGIPGRGVILTQLSNFWFRHFEDLLPNHLLVTDLEEFPEPYRNYPELGGRAVLVKKLRPIPIECVARGYITGSGWEEYAVDQTVCGIKLPAGLSDCEKLTEPIFTPATKATEGHDENISYERMVSIVGRETAEALRSYTLRIYTDAAAYAAERGIIIADTKFEFGIDEDGCIVWMDEALTPDSSRFWPVDGYEPGRSQPSFDKQFVRDWVSAGGWNKEPPTPILPPEVVAGTLKRYRRAYRLLTGEEINP